MRETDLLSRYLSFSEKSGTINRAISAVRPDVERALSGGPGAMDELLRFNDLQLFLMQVLAFDGFVTACCHELGLPKHGSMTQRLQRLADCTLKQSKTYQGLLSHVGEIERIRDAWVHGLGDATVLQDPSFPPHLFDRFGLAEHDGSLWVELPHVMRGGRTTWSFIVCTLHGMAKLVWGSVAVQLADGAPPNREGPA